MLSSMHIPAMPAASNACTARIALIALPNAVSQSAITGIATASLITRDAASVSVIVRMLASGTPWLALISKPLAHTPLKPASCTSRAESPSWAPASTIGPGDARRRRSFAADVSREESLMGKTERYHDPPPCQGQQRTGDAVDHVVIAADDGRERDP